MSGSNQVSPVEVAACLAWPGMLFVIGWMTLTGLDFALRSQHGDLRGGGFPRDVWFLAHGVLAAVSVFSAWASWRRFRPVWRVGLIVLLLCAGLPLYFYACVAYGIYLGYDAF